MCDLDDLELEAWVSEHILGLEGVGYYRRKSCYTSEQERCEKGDHTPDYPDWVADTPYYLIYPKENPTRAVRVPYLTICLNETAKAELKLEEMGLETIYINTLHFEIIGADIDDYLGPTIRATARQRCEAMYAIREDILQLPPQ